MDYTNKALGLRVQTQIPLNVKGYKQNEESLKNLGTNNNLAFTYEQGLIVYCWEEGTRWEWREVQLGEENTGLLDSDFIYPTSVIIFDIDYSNKSYNFFPFGGNDFEVPDATNIVKGILKLTNDLGGTADLPTTPTALHKTTDESWTGIKSSTNTGSTLINGLNLLNNGTGTSSVLAIGNNSITGFGADINNTNTGIGLRLRNTTNGTGIEINNLSSGYGLVIANSGIGPSISAYNSSSGSSIISNISTSGTGFAFIGQNNFVNTFTVNKLGDIVANKYTKTGGTAQQILIANGTVRELNPQKEITSDYIVTNADDGYVIFINNNTTPITITINTTVTASNFSVGFIQEGTADVTFIGTGITLTNPIGLKSKGQGYQTFIERKLSTSNYYLLGNTKI